jgi:outer membrane protein
MLRTALALLLVVYGAQAQHKWTLQECIEYAKSHNIALKQAVLGNQTDHNNARQTFAGSLPSLNAGATHMYNVGKTIDRFTNTFANSQVLSQNFYLSSNVVLWQGFTQYNSIKASHYNYLSGVEQTKQQEYDLSLNVANAFINVIFSEELLKVSQNQFEVTKSQLDQTLKLVNAGAAAKSVEFDIRAQLSNEELNVTTADNNYQLALLTLRQIMYLDSSSGFAVQRPDIEVQENALLSADIQRIYETSLNTLPSIRSSNYAIQSAERYLAASRGRISPVLSFNASLGTGTSGLARDVLGVQYTGYQAVGITSQGDSVFAPLTELVTRKTPFADQFRDNINKSFGFTLNIPLLNGLQTHTAIKNAKLSAYNAKLSQDLLKQNLYQDIARAYTNARAALNKYNASKLSVEAAAESFRYAQVKLNAGAISSFDFTTSKNRLFAAESNLLQAKYDYVFKLKVLDFYQGKPLGF